MPDDLVIAHNPEPDSSLPYLIRIPLGEHGIVVKARETWPRTSKIYCHRAEAWPDQAEWLRQIFKLAHVTGATVAESLAEAQARFPSVPIVFCETRALVQEWTYRWFGAYRREHDLRLATDGVEDTFAAAGPLPAPADGPAAIRAWARAQGLAVSDRGRVPGTVRQAWERRAEPTV